MHKCIDQAINAANQLPPATREFLGISSGIEFPVFGSLDQDVGLRKESVHDINTGV